MRSRVAVLPCAVAVYPRRRLLSVAVCALARCAARLLNAGVNCALALQCCRVQSLSILGVGCSPSPCALARCAARLLCRRQLRSEMLRGCSRAGRGRRGWETILIFVCDGELPLRVCEITPAFKCEGLRAVGPSYPGGRSRWLGRCSGDLAGSLRQARTYGSERTETLCQTHGISLCVGSCVRAFTK